MVLVVMDTQKLVIDERLYKFDLFVANMKRLIEEARKNDVEVIYVRHDAGEGQQLTKGTDGFEIYDEFNPIGKEKIFDKNFNSAFRGTGLVEYLKDKGEKDVIITGLQTDYCVDATVKCGFEHGFNIIVPAGCNTTFDNKFMTGEESYKYYNELIWNGRYAKCCELEETIRLIKRRAKRE